MSKRVGLITVRKTKESGVESDTEAEDKVKARSRKARASRDKGRRGELLAANKLCHLWATVERLAQDRGGNCAGPDIQVVEALLDVEVRHRGESSIPGAVQDAKTNCRPGHTWAAVDWPTGRGNRGPTITLDLDQWIDLILAERERAERAGFEAGQLSTAVCGQPNPAQPKLSRQARVEPVQSGSLLDLFHTKLPGVGS